MTTKATMTSATTPAHDLSIAKGGPFFDTLIRVGLMRPDLEPMHRRALALSLLAWLPLLALSALPSAVTSGVSVPFLADFPVAVRFLVAVPCSSGPRTSWTRARATSPGTWSIPA